MKKSMRRLLAIVIITSIFSVLDQQTKFQIIMPILVALALDFNDWEFKKYIEGEENE